ncbi:hypothetical protein MPTK1_3g09950 [Marchantia polymorpha subsp. ruderalis]|uniref:Uncharacterized protein n=2 Tax=Marchantia polymorpha TaxID=3197 RepID=A0AAF6AZ79_MARPO|nr:hypothetical protein MARPO_0085s0032 [Marchantia polymorpha]BBN05063.1 hypothetical protein Mp_3g09950 [Marchantia polymorpha subsp. ruderalis]|eukprot:PTQ33811.1 hypothetical protein MARPO_0085s0032 [Marchantia polymorpha]
MEKNSSKIVFETKSITFRRVLNQIKTKKTIVFIKDFQSEASCFGPQEMFLSMITAGLRLAFAVDFRCLLTMRGAWGTPLLACWPLVEPYRQLLSNVPTSLVFIAHSSGNSEQMRSLNAHGGQPDHIIGKIPFH